MNPRYGSAVRVPRRAIEICLVACALVLSASPAWAISSRTLIAPTGEAVDDRLGRPVASAGDVNGDGYGDVIVGAQGYSGNTGRAYVYYGGLDADAVADLTLTGEAASNYFGFSAGPAGDVNGDGYADVIVGAYGYSVNTGRAYVYYGGPGADAVADLTLTGEAAGAYFGWSVAAAGDVNGDGYGDVIVGAFAYSGNTGQAFVYYGGPGADGVADLTLVGEAVNNGFGRSVASARDVNGDGYGDVIVGAQGYGGNTGRSYVYYGGPGADAVADLTLTGEATGNLFGWSVGSAGDVNGDGYGDVIVGAQGYSSSTGRAYVYYGGPGADAVADLTMTGEVAGDRLGNSVSSAGDVNGNGYGDVIVGAFGYSSNTGRAYVYYGGPGADAVADLTLTGGAPNDYFGRSVASAGDVNGDGFGDVIVGADGYSGNQGRAYVTSIYPYEVLSPNGGEHWAAGEPDTVRWRGHDLADLAISYNSGSSWTKLATGIGGLEENAYALTAPTVATSTAKVALCYTGMAVAAGQSDWSDSVFTIDVPTHTITATAGSNGSIVPSGAISVAYGSNQTFTITPGVGYAVADVIVDGVSQGPMLGYTFTNVIADHTIHATFRTTALDGTWIRIGSPDGRAGHSVIYDASRDRLVLFGGVNRDGTLSNDVWLLQLSGSQAPRWIPLDAGGTPPPKRFRHSAIYDPVRQRVLVFGGYDGSGVYFNDVWSLSLPRIVGGLPVGSSWTQLGPTGTPPGARMGQAAIYDPVRDRMVVHSGVGPSTRYGDLWSLSLSGTPAWSDITPVASNPTPREGHVAVYDSGRDQMVIFGGSAGSVSGSPANDAWTLSLAGTPAWTVLAPGGTPPAARAGSMAVYDVDSNRMLVYGGWTGVTAVNDTWSLGLSGSPAWTQLSPTGTIPPARHQGGVAYRTSADEVLLIGGVSADSLVTRLDLFRFEDGTPSWTIVPVEPGAPSVDWISHGVYDSARKRIVTIGQMRDGGNRPPTLALSLDWIPKWSILSDSGRSFQDWDRMIHDPVRDRIVSSSVGEFTFVLPLAGTPTWQLLPTAGPTPPVHYEHTAVYDPVGDRLIMATGGDGDLYHIYNDVWSLTLGGTPTWTEILPAGTPPLPRYQASGIYDPVERRVILFGGDRGSPLAATNEVWALSLAGTPTWTQLLPLGMPPAARAYHSAIYDSARHRMIVYGGSWTGITPVPTFGDVWALSLAEPVTWTLLAPAGEGPGIRGGHVAVYDPIYDRLIVMAGVTTPDLPYTFPIKRQLSLNTWALEWGAITAVENPETAPETPARIVRAWPNPFGRHASIEFQLPRPARARLAVFGVSGRLVRILHDGPLPAGQNRMEWDGLDRAGRRVGAGVYFLRLEVGGRVSTHRAVVLR